MTRWVVAVAVPWLSVCCGAARSAPLIESLGVGVAGVYRTDRWCPLDVRFADVEAQRDYVLDVAAVDPAGRAIDYRWPVRFAAGDNLRVGQLVRLGSGGAPIVATLRDADRVIVAERRIDAAELAKPLAGDESLVLVIGRLAGLDAVRYAPESRRAVFRQLATTSQLPSSGWRSLTDRTLALDVADTVVWLAGQNAGHSDSEQAGELLDAWIRGGGRLILSLGPQAAQSPAVVALLRRLNVMDELASTELRQIGPLEAFIGDAARSGVSVNRAIGNPASDASAFHLTIARLPRLDGNVVARTGQTADAMPLVVRVPHGFGEVVVVAFDLGDDALVGWPGHARLLSKVFALGEPAAPAPADESAQTAWSGKAYDSLADQLADALDQFPGASPARFWYLAAAAVVYALVVGPLDWYIVRRRPEWTWATFLATVALAAAGGYAVVHATKPNATLANEIAFVDVDLTAVPPDASGDLSSRSPAAARIRGSAWTCFYQGAAVTTDVDIIPRMPWSNSSADAVALAATPPMARLSLWDRSSTAAMAGLLPNRVLGPDSRVTYHAAGAISSLSRPAWSTQHVAGEWSFDAAAFPSVAALAPDAFGRVVGHVRNPLDEPLEQAVLLYGSFAHALGKLAPGQSIAIDGRGDWRSIESFLTRRRFNEDRETAERYDAAGFDLDRIGEIIGFYDAAGGRRYVGLDRGGFRRLDLTQQLRLGRAILLGKTSSAVRVAISASGSRDDDVGEADDAATPHRQTAWWRFLIRVSGANTPPTASAPAMPNRRRRP